MKTRICIALLAMVLFGCNTGPEKKIYQPRAIVKGEDFNTYGKTDVSPLAVFTSGDSVNPGEKEVFTVKFRDTAIAIQPSATDKDFVADKFSLAHFVNTQKTCLLVQLADSTGLVAPFYLITLKNDALEVVNLYRPSNGKLDTEITKGMLRVGSRGFLINNDFFVTNVKAKVYFIERQKADERIQGEFFMHSADKETFVFLLDQGFYQVHYPSAETFMQPFPSQPPSAKPQLYRWVQSNFTWQKNSKGNSFLKADADDNRIVDIKEFR